MRKLLTFILLFGLLIVQGCIQKTDKVTTAQLIISSGVDSIIFLNNYFADYINAAEGSNQKQLDYANKVVSPIMTKYFSKSEYSFLVQKFISEPSYDITELQKQNNFLLNEQTKIKENIISALTDLNRLIKNDGVSIYIFPVSQNYKYLVQQTGGVLGLTAGSKQILLFIDPTVNSWEQILKYSVAHEFHHSYWTFTHSGNYYIKTLLDYLIFEGKADYFAHLVYPNIEVAWTSSLSEMDKYTLWNSIKGKLNSTDHYFQNAVMFGSSNYPHWGGYGLGYDMVKTFLKDKGAMTVKDWTSLEPETILSGDNYDSIIKSRLN